MDIVEVCSIIEGAWYEVIPDACSIVWIRGKPRVRIAFKDYDSSDAEFFSLEDLFAQRFRCQAKLATQETDWTHVRELSGFAQSNSEAKWFDAFFEGITQTEDDILVHVDWTLGLYFHIFGEPKNSTLSVESGEVSIPGEILDPFTTPFLRNWAQALMELAKREEFPVNIRDRTPLKNPQFPDTKLVTENLNESIPLSYLMKNPDLADAMKEGRNGESPEFRSESSDDEKISARTPNPRKRRLD